MSKKLEEYSREELIETVRQLKERKKFGLVWEDKPEDVVTACQQALPVLAEVEERAITGHDGPTHIVIEGDNYHALSTLNFSHSGAVDLIYIDPPYNTGKKNEWKYNDHYVDKNDTYKHSKWLSMMAKRLMLSKSLLKEDGVILISIDDHELAQLRLLADSIFTEQNWLETFVWNTEGNIDNQRKIKSNHEYIVMYAKNAELFAAPRVIDPNIGTESKLYKDMIENSIIKNGPKNPVSAVTIPAGFPTDFASGVIKRRTKGWPVIDRDVHVKDHKTQNEFVAESGWSSLNLLKEYIDNAFQPILDGKQQITTFGLTKTGAIYNYKQRSSDQSHVLSVLTNFGTTKKESERLKRMGITFDYPKPVDLIKYLLQMHNNKNSVVLDFFAGSGTTGEATLKLNDADNGQRQFIICTNNENDIADTVTYPRIVQASKDYPANVRYFKTDFVDKQKTNDQTRLALVGRCTDMIRVRENAFHAVISTTDFTLFESHDHYAAVVFDPLSIAAYIRQIEEHDTTKPVNLYIFSYSNYAYDDDIPQTELQYTTCPIPESILEIYKRIFETKDTLNA